MTTIKTFLTYLTFCILLILCYIEKEKARSLRDRIRATAVRQAGVVPGSPGRNEGMPRVAGIAEPAKHAGRLYRRGSSGSLSE